MTCWLIGFTLVLSTGLIGCTSASRTEPIPPGLARIEWGVSTDSVMPYEGGMLYSGFTLTEVDHLPVDGDRIIVLPAGVHHLAGQCYWRLRGVPGRSREFFEKAAIDLQLESGVAYRLEVDVDEYKSDCQLTVRPKLKQPQSVLP